MHAIALMGLLLGSSPSVGALLTDGSDRCALLEAILRSEGEVDSGQGKRHVRPFIEVHGKLVTRRGVLWLRVTERSGEYWPDPGCRSDLRFISVVPASFDPEAPWEILQINLTRLMSGGAPKIRFTQHTAIFKLPPEVDGIARLPWCYRGNAWKTERGWMAKIDSWKGHDFTKSACR
jgi:hypothetical protein